jgi:hypothetical protein
VCWLIILFFFPRQESKGDSPSSLSDSSRTGNGKLKNNNNKTDMKRVMLSALSRIDQEYVRTLSYQQQQQQQHKKN